MIQNAHLKDFVSNDNEPASVDVRVFHFGADDFQDDHAEGVDGTFTVTELEGLAIVEPFNDHVLISDRCEGGFKVGNVSLQTRVSNSFRNADLPSWQQPGPCVIE